MGASADADPDVVPAGPAQECAQAAIADIRLPRLGSIDEIVVQVADNSPELGAARITVEADEFYRALNVHGGSHGLAFSTPLVSAEFRVILDPTLSAPAPACVESIELRSRGRLVAAVRP